MTVEPTADPQFITYMAAFQAATEHTATCELCQDGRPCPIGDPIHHAFLTEKTAWEDEQRHRFRSLQVDSGVPGGKDGGAK
ncbi:hypothetical protein ACFVVU_21765 [Kitasatospora sp. NPDC057965]|uniref:hypothetical protein n=1 Tax=Kitasatospora sp. NPDC057965 TaxID=3346291 RepID=UPI0036DA1955